MKRFKWDDVCLWVYVYIYDYHRTQRMHNIRTGNVNWSKNFPFLYVCIERYSVTKKAPLRSCVIIIITLQMWIFQDDCVTHSISQSDVDGNMNMCVYSLNDYITRLYTYKYWRIQNAKLNNPRTHPLFNAIHSKEDIISDVV